MSRFHAIARTLEGEATIEFEFALSNPNKRKVTLEPTLSLSEIERSRRLWKSRV